MKKFNQPAPINICGLPTLSSEDSRPLTPKPFEGEERHQKVSSPSPNPRILQTIEDGNEEEAEDWLFIISNINVLSFL